MPITQKYIPLSYLLPASIGTDLQSLLGTELFETSFSNIGVSTFSSEVLPLGTRYVADACIFQQLGLPLLAFPGVEISINPNGVFLEFSVAIDITEEVILKIKSIYFAIIITNSMLQPVELVDNKFVVKLDSEGNVVPLSILFSPFDLVIGKSGLSVEGNSAASVQPFMVGSSGIVIEMREVRIFLAEHGSGTKGFSITQGIIHLPKELKGALPLDIILENLFVSEQGLSGSIYGNWTPELKSDKSGFADGVISISLWGFQLALSKVFIQFENNYPAAVEVECKLLLPYFNDAITARINVRENGDFDFGIAGGLNEPIVIQKENLLQFFMQEFTIKNKSGIGTLLFSGAIEPLLFTQEGMKWPRLDVKNLMLDSMGKFSIEEAWLDLKDMATLDLFGFHMELRKIGIGTQGEDKLWIDLSGGLKLIEQIPIGLDVEGFRITWPQNKDFSAFGVNDIGIQFKGVEFSFGVPGALQLDGLIRFFKDTDATGFAGDMILVIPAAGITAEAGLLAGLLTYENKPLPFFYVYFGLESTAGIPLGQSGLALKGAIGLFGINVKPNRQEGQNWYHDWYKKDPAPGAHQTTKWEPEPIAFAIGAGMTITTADGIVKGTKGIFVLALPGPIIVINGKALVLDGLNPNPNAEPPFSATAIFDGHEKIVQFNIEAQAEIVEDVIDAYAGIEAFFDFKDLTNWHLYLGENEPKDRRIRANILKVIEADAYLMLDMLDANSPRARMGAEINIKPKIDSICFEHPFGEECITFDAHVHIGGNGQMSMQPEQFSGNAFLDAGIEIKALGIELEIGADASLSIEGPSPFSLQAELNLHANLPDPLPDYDDTFQFELTIPNTELTIQDPLATVSLFSRFTSESKSTPIYPNSIYPNSIPDDQLSATDANGNYIVPMVECDINPILAFEHEMNQDYNFIMFPGGEKTYPVGAIEYRPELKKVIIREKKKDGNQPWVDLYSTELDGNNPFVGTWLAESDPASPGRPASRRLQLLSANPLTNTMHSTGTMGYLMMQSEAASKHLSELILDDYPELITCSSDKPKPVCVDFNYNGKAIQSTKIKWSVLELSSTGSLEISGSCLHTFDDLTIRFPEDVILVIVEFCEKSRKTEWTAFSDLRREKLIMALKEAKGKKIKPDLECVVPVTITNDISKRIHTIEAKDSSINCLHGMTKDKGGLQIKSICFLTRKAQTDADLNAKICDANLDWLDPRQSLPTAIFRPGCYYEIEVLSHITGEVITSRIEESPVKGYIIDQYQDNLNHLPSLTPRFAYFQTEAPPQNLEPYVKWSVPFHQENRIYRKDPVCIRFKRGYMEMLFGEQATIEHQLNVYLKDTNGSFYRIDHQHLSWLPTSAATLFPDEATWKGHLNTYQLEAHTTSDDLLQIKLQLPDGVYNQNNRYELLLIGMRNNGILNNTGKPKNNIIELEGHLMNVLSSRLFTSSRFDSFTAIMASASGIPIDLPEELLIPTEVETALNFIPFMDTLPDVNFNFNMLSALEVDDYKMKIDYEYGLAQVIKDSMVLVSKEAVEETKLKLRAEQDKLDEAFRNLALRLHSELYFEEAQKMEMYAMTKDLENAEWLWLKFPEPVSFNYNSIGLRRLTIELKNALDETISSKMVCNSDTTQILFKLDNAISKNEMKTISIQFTYKKDFKDDIENFHFFGTNENIHHRYDRPSLVQVPDEVIRMKFI